MKKPNIFKRIFTFLQNWYERFFEKFEGEGLMGVEIVNWVKEQYENGNAEAIANFTETELDDFLYSKGKVYLVPLFETYLRTNQIFLTEGASRLEVVQTLFSYVSSLPKKRTFWVEFAGDLIVYLSDGKLDWNEAVLLGQKLFWQFFGKGKELEGA